MSNVFIIAGASQCGTTSLFELIAKSESIYPSKIKELDFWIDDSNEEDGYFSCFHDSENFRSGIYFEASPAYLRHSDNVSRKLCKLSKNHNLKVLFVLRPPEERLFSMYRKMKNDFEEIRTLSYDQFLDQAFSGVGGPIASELKCRADVGFYRNGIDQFISQIGEDNVRIVKLSELLQDKECFLNQLSIFLETKISSPGAVPKTNSNTAVKSFLVHSVSKKIYMAMEPLIRNKPYLRKKISDAYRRLNMGGKIKETSSQRKRACAYYGESYSEFTLQYSSINLLKDKA